MILVRSGAHSAAAPAAGPSLRREREVAPLDFARFFAAQFVMLYHLVFLSWAEGAGTRGIRAVVGHPVSLPEQAWWSSLGWVGVQVFFVISGFVILMSAEGKSGRDFVIGRIKRVAPALWFFSLCSACVLVSTGVLPPFEALTRLARSLVLYPMGPWIDGAVWTLVAEALFYAVIYLLIRAGWLGRLGRLAVVLTVFNATFWLAVLAGDAGALGAAGAMLADAAQSYRLRVTLVTTNAYFVLGAALYHIHAGRSGRFGAAIYWASFLAGFAATYFAARSSIGVAQFGEAALRAPIVWAAVVLTMSAAVLLRLGSGTRMRSVARVLGLLTYPLYLINQICGGFLLRLAYDAGLPPGCAIALVAGACTGLAAAFSLLLERRLQQRLEALLRRRWRPQPA